MAQAQGTIYHGKTPDGVMTDEEFELLLTWVRNLGKPTGNTFRLEDDDSITVTLNWPKPKEEEAN
jgi:hypothetical protein